MTIGTLRQLAFASFAILVLVGCARERPIYQVENKPMPQSAQSLSPAQIEARIIEAGIRERWRIRPVGPGRLRGTTSWSRHFASVDIDYDTRAYSIRYQTSRQLSEGIAPQDHMYAGKRVIHKMYNRRIRELDRAIGHELALPAQ